MFTFLNTWREIKLDLIFIPSTLRSILSKKNELYIARKIVQSSGNLFLCVRFVWQNESICYCIFLFNVIIRRCKIQANTISHKDFSNI